MSFGFDLHYAFNFAQNLLVFDSVTNQQEIAMVLMNVA